MSLGITWKCFAIVNRSHDRSQKFFVFGITFAMARNQSQGSYCP